MRDGLYGSDVDYWYQDRFFDLFDEYSEEEWNQVEVRRRDDGLRRREEGNSHGEKGMRMHLDGSRKPYVHAAINTNKELPDDPQFRRFVTFYFTNFPSNYQIFIYRKVLRYVVCWKRWLFLVGVMLMGSSMVL